MRIYSLYGCRIASGWELPGAASGEPNGVDFELSEGPPDFFADACREAAQQAQPGQWSQYWRLADGADYLRWPGLFEFLISADGRRVVGRPLGDADWESFQTYLLGQVLSFALLKRGIEHLHCTAVVVDGGTVGLIGDCGFGKSSLAAAFIQAGYPLVTDDLLVLKAEGPGFLAYPSFPRIKLLPEAAQAFLGEQANGAPMNPYTQKRIIPLRPDQYCPTALPIRAFFVLRPSSRGNRLTIRRLRPRQAVMDLIANTFNAKIKDSDRLRGLLAWCAPIAAAIPVKSLSYPRGLTLLPRIVEGILVNLAKDPVKSRKRQPDLVEA